jgi:hypothetical protein
MTDKVFRRLEGLGVSDERHYRLSPPEDLDSETLEAYRRRPE